MIINNVTMTEKNFNKCFHFIEKKKKNPKMAFVLSQTNDFKKGK